MHGVITLAFLTIVSRRVTQKNQGRVCGLQGSLTGISVKKRARTERLIFAPSSSICVCPLSSSSEERQGECRSNGHVVNGCANGKEGKGCFLLLLILLVSFLFFFNDFGSVPKPVCLQAEGTILSGAQYHLFFSSYYSRFKFWKS